MPSGAQCDKQAPCHGICRVRGKERGRLPEQMSMGVRMKRFGQDSGLQPERWGLGPAAGSLSSPPSPSPQLSRFPSLWLELALKTVKANRPAGKNG